MRITFPNTSHRGRGRTSRSTVSSGAGTAYIRPDPDIALQDAADGAKTSEYVAFKKLKAQAIGLSHSPSKLYKKNISKRFKAGDYPHEMTTMTHISPKHLKSLMPVDKVEQFSHESFHSPADRLPKNPVALEQLATAFGEKMEQHYIYPRPEGVHLQHSGIFARKRQKLQQWVRETSFPEIDELCSRGNDIVTVLLSRLFAKRDEKEGVIIPNSKQLNRTTKSKFLAAPHHDTGFHQMSKKSFFEAGYLPYLENDPSAIHKPWQVNRTTKSALLSFSESDSQYTDLRQLSNRSFVDSKNISNLDFDFENFSYLDNDPFNPIPGQVNCAPKSKLLTSPPSYFRHNKLHQIWDRSFVEAGYKPCLENRPLSCWLGSSKEQVFSDLEFPNSNTQNTLAPFLLGDLNLELEWMLPNPYTKSESGFYSNSKNFKPPLIPIEDIDHSYMANGSIREREQHPLLLGWEYENWTNTNATPSCQNTELITYKASPSRYTEANELTADNEFDTLGPSGLCAPFVLYKNPLDLSSLCAHRASCSELEFRRHRVPDMEANVNMGQFPLRKISRTPTYANLTNYCDYNSKEKESAIHNWPMNKIFDRTRSDATPHSFTGFNVDMGRKRNRLMLCDSPIELSLKENVTLSSFTADDHSFLDDQCSGKISHFGEDKVNSHDWSSFCSRLTLDCEKALLLVNKSNCTRSTDETCSDIDDEVGFL